MRVLFVLVRHKASELVKMCQKASHLSSTHCAHRVPCVQLRHTTLIRTKRTNTPKRSSMLSLLLPATSEEADPCAPPLHKGQTAGGTQQVGPRLALAGCATPHSQPALADSRPCFLTNTSCPFCAQLGQDMLERSWRMHLLAPLLCHVANVFPSLLLRTLLSQNPRGFHAPFLNQKGRNMNCSDVCSGMRLKTHSREMGFCCRPCP